MKDTQLLCTFTTTDKLDDTIKQILQSYDLVFEKVYILEVEDDPNDLILTYNVSSDSTKMGQTPDSTISVHRKKQTNTIYSINGINALIEEKLGYLDKSYRIDWEELQNTVLVTAYGDLRRLSTNLKEIRDV